MSYLLFFLLGALSGCMVLIFMQQARRLDG